MNDKKLFKQQGDVLLYRVDSLPKNLNKEDTLIVQHGEATGHAHRLEDGGIAEIYCEEDTKRRFIKIMQEAGLSHEEHKMLRLPVGTYEIGIVKEYDHWAEEARNVVD